MGKAVRTLAAAALAVAGLLVGSHAVLAAPKGAASRMSRDARPPNPWPHVAAGGFSTPSGRGIWVVYQDGGVDTYGTARTYGETSRHPQHSPVVGGVSDASGDGYWLVTARGGVMHRGNAANYGSLASFSHTSIVGMARTSSGHGYWLVAKDGQVFSFGDAKFQGSAAGHASGIVGLTRSVSGYRLLGSHGRVFSYGHAQNYGSLSGPRGHAAVGLASTSTGHGYWIAGADGTVVPFGDAQNFGSYTLPSCDVVVGIVANPSASGYRLVLQHGATIPYGMSPAGNAITGTEHWCYAQTACVPRLASATSYQALLDVRGPLWDGADGGIPVDLGGGRRLWLFNDTFLPLHGPPGYKLVRNSVAIEQGNCFTYRIGGSTSSASYLPRARLAGYRRWYWPEAGVADPARNVVYVTALRMQATSLSAHGFWDWHTTGVDLITLDGRSLAQKSTIAMPTPAGLSWGSAMFLRDGMIYLYANAGGVLYAARSTPAALASGHWQFATAAGWTTQVAALQPMVFRTSSGAPDTGPMNSFTVDRAGTGYLLGASRCDVLCNDVTAWRASTPAGPWVAVDAAAGRVATATGYAGQLVYSGHLVHTAHSWLAAWSTDGPGAATSSLVGYYGVHVVPANFSTAP